MGRHIVRLSYHSKYPMIFTTNWDCHLEHAATQLGIPYQLYFSRPENKTIPEIANGSPKKIHIFKIHGTLGTRRLESPLIFTLTQEAQRLSVAQYSLLKDAFELPMQLVIGYSCGESDLFPAFARSPATNLIWNIRNLDSNPLLSHLLASKQATVVFADMRSLISKACHAIGIYSESECAHAGEIDLYTKAHQILKGWLPAEIAYLLIRLFRGLPISLKKHLLVLLQDDINAKTYPLRLGRRIMEEAELSAFNINFGIGKYDLAHRNLKLPMQQPTNPIVYFRAIRKGGLLVAAEQDIKKALEYIARLEKDILDFFKCCYDNGYKLSSGALRVRSQIILDKVFLLLTKDTRNSIKTIADFDKVTCGSLVGPISGDLDLEGRKHFLKAFVQLKKEGSLEDAMVSLLFAKERYWLAGHFVGIHECEVLLSEILKMSCGKATMGQS